MARAPRAAAARPGSPGGAAARDGATGEPLDWGLVLRVAALVAGAIGAIALIAWGWFGTADPEEVSLPAQVTLVDPVPGAIVAAQSSIRVVLADGYTGVIVLDGVEIPEDQLDRSGGIDTALFRPGAGRVVAELSPGEHRVTVVFWQIELGRANESSFSWRFRSSG